MPNPSFLLLHGDQDELVPLSQSEELYWRLEEAGVPVMLVVVKDAGHTFVPVSDKPIAPSRQQITQIIAHFFDGVLEQSSPAPNTCF